MEILSVFLGYIIGSIPTAYLLAKRQIGQDIRTIGTKNMGTTNISHTMGGKWAALVFIIDFSKGILPFILTLYAFDLDMVWVMISCCASVLGHNYPVWLGFRGGKGAATAGGALGIYTFTQGYVWEGLAFIGIVLIFWAFFKNYVGGATVGFILMPLFYLIDNNLSGCWFAIALLILVAIKFIPPAIPDIKRFFHGQFFKKRPED